MDPRKALICGRSCRTEAIVLNDVEPAAGGHPPNTADEGRAHCRSEHTRQNPSQPSRSFRRDGPSSAQMPGQSRRSLLRLHPTKQDTPRVYPTRVELTRVNVCCSRHLLQEGGTPNEVLADGGCRHAADGAGCGRPTGAHAGRAHFEVKFMTDMIDHHMMAVMMSEHCVEKAVHEELRTMCKKIIAVRGRRSSRCRPG